MKIKLNQVLIGIIFLLVGAISLFTDFINLNYSGSMLLFSGLAFLLLYRTKHKSWSLIVGMYLSYLAVAGFLRNFSLFRGINLYGAMFFIVPGLIFLILFLDKNKKGLLAPGSFLLWFGIYICISGFALSLAIQTALVYFCICGASFMIYFFSREAPKKWTLYCIYAFGAIGLLQLFGAGLSSLSLSRVISFAIIFIGIRIIYKSTKKP